MRSIEHCAIERSAVKHNAHDGTYTELTRSCDRTHIIGLNTCGNAIERTPDLVAHLILSINRTLCIFIWFYAWEAPLGPQTLCFALCNPPKLSIIYLMFYFTFN